MNSIIFPIVYSTGCSILIFFMSKIKHIFVKILLLLFAIQISAIIHELAHLSQANQGSYIFINSFYYIPIVGFIWGMDVMIYITTIKNNFVFGSIGFLLQFLYLVICASFIFRKSILSLFVVSFGFIIYLFIYGFINYATNTSDFYYWVKP
jgi:hypothetical protein